MCARRNYFYHINFTYCNGTLTLRSTNVSGHFSKLFHSAPATIPSPTQIISVVTAFCGLQIPLHVTVLRHQDTADCWMWPLQWSPFTPHVLPNACPGRRCRVFPLSVYAVPTSVLTTIRRAVPLSHRFNAPASH